MDALDVWACEDDFRDLPFDEDIDLTASGFRWRTAEGEVLTLQEMDTKHIFNSMKMCFNHLAEQFGGRPVWFNRQYGDYQRMAEEMPDLLAAITVFFVEEIERRKDLPEKYKHPYQQIVAQIKGNLLGSGMRLRLLEMREEVNSRG